MKRRKKQKSPIPHNRGSEILSDIVKGVIVQITASMIVGLLIPYAVDPLIVIYTPVPTYSGVITVQEQNSGISDIQLE